MLQAYVVDNGEYAQLFFFVFLKKKIWLWYTFFI